MRLTQNQRYKSLAAGAVTGVELPAFTVLTGPNGSGKSNLLEALQQNLVTFDDLGVLPAERVRRFGIGELLAAAEGPTQGSAYAEPWANLYNSIRSWKEQSPQLLGPGATDDQIEQWATQQAVANKMITPIALARILERSGKRLIELDVEDFRAYGPLILGVRDPFSASIAEVFLSYSIRKDRNDMAQWRLATKGIGSPLADEDFLQRFGPAPWDLLDDTMAIVGLPYKFEPPPDGSEAAQYEVLLRNEANETIRPSDLSSGERVLLAVAMSLFTGARMSEAIELPQLLLLDEADASLHPSMVKSLLTVIEDIFIAQYGVRVILATHSPSTVALCPEEALFAMSRSGIKLKKASTDEALQLLTVGIGSLSVRVENRRQVFVESEYDQSIYQELFTVLKSRIPSEKSIEFVAVGRRNVGGGCDMVKRLVRELRGAGIDTVFGIVDRDGREGSPPYVHYIADRYSVENLILDPLLLGTLLLRERILAPGELGLPADLRHFELKSEHAQLIIEGLAERLQFSDGSASVDYLGGFTESLPGEFLDTRGHDLEETVITVFPQLRRFGANLKSEVVKRAASDVPAFVPRAALSLFEVILAA